MIPMINLIRLSMNNSFCFIELRLKGCNMDKVSIVVAVIMQKKH